LKPGRRIRDLRTLYHIGGVCRFEKKEKRKRERKGKGKEKK